MPFFGKSKPKKEKVKKGAPIQVGNLPPSAPGFHKCYFLGAIPAEPTREGSEQAFAKIVYVTPLSRLHSHPLFPRFVGARPQYSEWRRAERPTTSH